MDLGQSWFWLGLHNRRLLKIKFKQYTGKFNPDISGFQHSWNILIFFSTKTKKEII